ncbi:unnamed protein product [Linum tenue]|uniref:Uncharacterized protein n=2 Tax=Linum tenue TaxID=586396 RepID=A0AAV0KMB9_9ROSI|nr:unnamed protein product [Linum tenue]
MDQSSPPGYMPTFFFYGPKHDPKPSSQNDVVDKLKSTLSTTLTHYYPLAGRYGNDGVSIDCNDRGATFVVAHVAHDMSSSVLEAPDEDRLVQLLPCPPQEKCLDDDDGKLILLTVRVNFFDCGGIAIAACAFHGVADASSLSCFLQSWAAICRGDTAVNDLLKGAVVDYSSLFPSQDLPPQPKTVDEEGTDVEPKRAVVAKRFLFPGSKIAELREKIGCFRGRQRTRVEAMSSLMWAASIRVSQQKKKEATKEGEGGNNKGLHSAVMVVNLRTRTSPPLPAMCMGNLIQLTEPVTWPVEEEVTAEEGMGELAGKLSGAVRRINHEYLKKLHENESEGYFGLNKSFGEEYAKDDFIMISSSCRYPTYGADFGWGKPVSVNGFAPNNKMVVLLDAKDGEGIEAWVTLYEDDMAVFEKDSDLLYYAS